MQRPGVGLRAALVPPPAADAEARILLEGTEAAGPPLLWILPAARSQAYMRITVACKSACTAAHAMHSAAVEHACHCGMGYGGGALLQLQKGTCGGISESMASHNNARLSAAESMPARSSSSSSSLVRCKVAAFQHYAAMRVAGPTCVSCSDHSNSSIAGDPHPAAGTAGAACMITRPGTSLQALAGASHRHMKLPVALPT